MQISPQQELGSSWILCGGQLVSCKLTFQTSWRSVHKCGARVVNTRTRDKMCARSFKTCALAFMHDLHEIIRLILNPCQAQLQLNLSLLRIVMRRPNITDLKCVLPNQDQMDQLDCKLAACYLILSPCYLLTCYLLFVIRLLLTICYLLLATYHLLHASCYLLLTYLLLATYYLPLASCY